MSYKITVIGDGFVGKTSLLLRYTEDCIPGDYVPTIFDNYYGNIIVDNEEYNMLLTDTSGQEEYDRIRELAYFDIHCFVLCFCVNSQSSLQNVKEIWYPEIKKHDKHAKVILVGTKSDLRQKEPSDCLSDSKIRKVMNDIKAHVYVECSSLTRDGIDQVFQEAIRAIHSRNKRSRCTLL